MITSYKQASVVSDKTSAEILPEPHLPRIYVVFYHDYEQKITHNSQQRAAEWL